MSVGCPGSYRSLNWRARYTPELVADLLPVAVWDVLPERLVLVMDQCKANRGDGKCRHTCARDQWGEGCTVDGKHRTCYHTCRGHDQCGKCLCISPDRIGALRVRESDGPAALIDVRWAWQECQLPTTTRAALTMFHGLGYRQDEIASSQFISQQAVSLRIRSGHMALADWLNGAKRGY